MDVLGLARQGEPSVKSMRFVVTGCSRSGTKYMATLLRRLGVRCKHERVFNISRLVHNEEAVSTLQHYGEMEGDSSFLAAPYLSTFPPGTVVLHQVRHPVAVIRSHMGIHFFSDPYEPSEFLAFNHPDILTFIARHAPAVFRDENEVATCMRYWVAWNSMIQQVEAGSEIAYLRYRIEDMDESLLRRILDLIRVNYSDEDLQNVLQDVPRSVNRRPRNESISWATLPDGDAKRAVEELGSSYGYTVS
jgi:hypothetical protein